MEKIILPNVRKLFLTDPGFVQYEADLKGADAQVVAWEAEDEDLMSAFRAGLDVHVKNAEDMWGTAFTKLQDHAKKAKRKETKTAVHLTNYGGRPKTLSQSLSWTIKDAETFQRRWFSIHPNIPNIFHRKVRESLERNRTIHNRFGFRIVYFGRIDDAFTEALAWIPQSTVALTTFMGAKQLEERYWPEQLAPGWMPRSAADLAGILLQTHDSLNFQFPLALDPGPEQLSRDLAVPIPYPSPLTIPWELKRSTKSWGDMEECK